MVIGNMIIDDNDTRGIFLNDGILKKMANFDQNFRTNEEL